MPSLRSLLVLLAATASTFTTLVSAFPSQPQLETELQVEARAAPPTCATCNPTSGQNACAPGTVCLLTGTTYHCACEQGFKASADNTSPNQWRMGLTGAWAPYSNYVFVTPGTSCPVVCDTWDGIPADLCDEVPLRAGCVG